MSGEGQGDSLERAHEAARSKGCVVIEPNPNELFIDIDNEDALRTLRRTMKIVRQIEPNVKWTSRPSPSGKAGRYHVVVDMKREVSAIERIALQAILGSDLVREALSWKRLKLGAASPTLFFEKEERTT